MKTVPEMLRESAQTYEERNKLYGDNYKQFGHMMAALFPHGLTIQGFQQWNQIGVLIQIASKLSRYAKNFERGGHDDSLLDMAVYATMLREIDEFNQSMKALMAQYKQEEPSNASSNL